MRTLITFATLLFIAYSPTVFSQTATLSLPASFTAQTGSQVQIPITVTNFDTVCSISLVFTYDTTVLTFLNNPFVFYPSAGGLMDVNRDKNQYRFGWYTLMPFSLPDNDTLLLVNFTYLGGSTNLMWDLSQGSCVIGNCQTGMKACSWNNGSVIPLPMGEISGKLTYDNSSQSPLSQVAVVLKDQNGLALDTSFTDNQGNYAFQLAQTGVYNLSLLPPFPWTAVNSIDALKIVRHFAGIENLSGLSLRAADVNSNNYVNSSDALLVLKRYVGLEPSFPAGDWIFDNQSINMTSLSHQTLNIKALFMGDVDKSYQP